MRLLNTSYQIAGKLFSNLVMDPEFAALPWVVAMRDALAEVLKRGHRMPTSLYFSNKGLQLSAGFLPPSQRIILHWMPINSWAAWAFLSLGPDGKLQWSTYGGTSVEERFREEDMKDGKALLPSLVAHLQLVADSVRHMPVRV